MLLRTALLAFLAAAAQCGDFLPKPTLKPPPVSDAQQALVREGVRLHDEGAYDAAIEKYKQALEHVPDEPGALYEMAFSLFAKKNCPAAIETALKAARYDFPALSRTHGLIASCLDDTGRSQDAIKVYRNALKRWPSDYQLLFNLAITYSRTGNAKDARKTVQHALLANPKYASAHLLLANLYEKEGYRIPAILAFQRFLVLEPASQRSAGAVMRLSQLLGGNVKTEGNNITLYVGAPGKTDEGDFSVLETSLALIVGMESIDIMKEKKPEPVDRLSTAISVVVEGMEEPARKGKGFAARFYAPYFSEIAKQKMVEPMVRFTWQSGLPGAGPWLKDNEEKVREFLSWSQAYQWPE